MHTAHMLKNPSTENERPRGAHNLKSKAFSTGQQPLRWAYLRRTSEADPSAFSR